ncbi:MAG: cell division protein FtsW [Acidobacteriaceae bacterium]|jgi:cell division protein FtsW|nr:cell division protein FtsW [Acidobacteriaceae bacterium]
MGKRLSTDKTLFLAIVAMVTFGLVMVYSASSIIAVQGKYNVPPHHFFGHQLLWAGASFLVMMGMKRLDYRRFNTPSWAFGGVGVVLMLLIAAFVMDGAKHRWLNLGVGRLQPSELAKPALVVFVAFFLTRRIRAVNNMRFTLGGCGLVLGTLALAVSVADLGTAVVLVAATAVTFFVAGLDLKYLVKVAPVAALLLLAGIAAKPYRVGRMIAMLDPEHRVLKQVDPNDWILTYVRSSGAPPDAAWQGQQAKIALGSGGWFGLGLMDGKQKLFYLPEPHTDFIYAVIGEELGLLGTAAVLVGFFVVLWRGYRTFLVAPDDFGRYLALGVTTMIVWQALFNLTVVTGLGPTKGIPLPMISYGGSSLLATLFLVGLLLSVSERSN